MTPLIDKNTRLVVQGITGSAGAFHAKNCMDFGTNVVAGVTPGKGGQLFEGKVPVFDTVAEAKKATDCNASMILFLRPSQRTPSWKLLTRALNSSSASRKAFLCRTCRR